MVEGIAHLLRNDGIAVIETPYVRDMVERVEFDTIYHEHVFYYSLRSFGSIIGAHGLHVIDAERISVHGGSLRLYVAHRGSAQSVSPVTAELLAEEDALGLATAPYYEAFSERVKEVGTACARRSPS